MSIDLEMNNNVGREEEVQSISLPSQLYWRSTLGTPAAWSGSSSRGVYLMDDTNVNGSSSLIQNIVVDKRMLRLPSSLRDIVVQNLLSTDDGTPNHSRRRRGQSSRQKQQTNSSKSNIQLLSHPRIVGSAQSTIGSSTFFSSNNNRANTGIACMDIDNGNDDTITGSPSRYLLVGSSGGDCTIALYDLSYFGSDGYLYQQQQQSHASNNISSQSSTTSSLASVTHRPIAKSIRHQSSTTFEQDASAVPSGHKHPLLGCKWYPGDVKQMFVSASISGEILIWDVSNFVPVFATYAHIYTGISRGNNDNDDNGGKTVAPLQCMDLPKTPESCPNGNALLALGLGSSGRGVIQLCDAFRGGSATHELVGHSNGGVNSVLWDPYHPFRLASGGDDCTIRLWDIRKAGSAACLGILNRENEMFSGVGDVSSVNDDDYSTVIRKKQRASLSTTNNIRTASGIESHGSPVTSLAFAPGGDDLVSTGLDGKIRHWDLRPDSCFVSSIDAITSGKSSRDPSVAIGGRLYPTSFTDDNSKRTGLHGNTSSKRRRSYHHNKPSLAIVQPGSRSTTTLISTSSSNNNASSRGQITGYSLFGRRGKEPGCCDFTLNGHLSDVTCLLPITKAWDNLAVNSNRSTNTNHTVSFLTGGLDGMVLSWGSSRRRQYTVSSTDSTHENDISSNNMPQYSSSAHHAEQPSEDLDNW